MRKASSTLPVAAVALLSVAMASAPWASSGDPVTRDRQVEPALAAKLAPPVAGPDTLPLGPNPYLALLPDPDLADYVAWQRFVQLRGGAAGASDASALSTQGESSRRTPGSDRRGELVHEEAEPPGTRGENDSLEDAERVRRFGTGRREAPVARILGDLTNPPVDVVAVDPNTEDDGSIPLARDTGVGTTTDGVSTSGTIGDGPWGSAAAGTGDVDAYQVRGLAGQRLVVDIDTPVVDPQDPFAGLDSVVVVVDDSGQVVAFNDDNLEVGELDSLLRFTVPADGDYYVFVAGFFSLPLDFFDSGSGEGSGSEGDYAVSITQAEVDTDVFAVDLEVGDVLGLSLAGAGTTVQVLDPDGELVIGSEQDVSFVYPADTPLPGGGNAVADHVADEDGWHYLAVSGNDGGYELTAEVYRPALEDERPVQTLYLDFDGARLNTGVFGGAGVRELSPLRDFLGAWGLSDDDYEPLVREIVAVVEENVERDLRAARVDRDFRIRIRNSLDHRDPWGRENVSRVVVGGTIEESGVATIGIAQSIDPGNFEPEETALVLLDVLSGSDPEDPASLNAYLTDDSDRVGFVGQAVGNVTSHEAGHFFGDWHVDQFNDVLNLMDQGGNFPLLYGVGPDGVGGTDDDPDVDFGEDTFNPNEGFTGTEDTLSRIAAVIVR